MLFPITPEIVADWNLVYKVESDNPPFFFLYEQSQSKEMATGQVDNRLVDNPFGKMIRPAGPDATKKAMLSRGAQGHDGCVVS